MEIPTDQPVLTGWPCGSADLQVWPTGSLDVVFRDLFNWDAIEQKRPNNNFLLIRFMSPQATYRWIALQRFIKRQTEP